MKVGIVCPYDLGEPGGVQQITVDLARHLEAEGDSAVLIAAGTMDWHRGPGRDTATVPIGRSFKVTANQSRVPLTLSPMSFRRMNRALRGVDVVHVHEPLVPLAGWSALGTKKPLVATFHADAPDWVGRIYRALPVARRMRRAVLTAVSDAARESVPESWGDARIIPNAIDASAFDLPVGRVPRRIAFLGRDEPRKGLDIALAAFSEVHRRHPETEMLVMSDTREVEPVGVQFLGRVTEGEKHRILASSSIYIAPNTGGESFGIVLAEAMAAGCVVVASDLAAFRAVVGDNGVLFPVGDVYALAREIIALLGDESRRESLSAAGKAAIQRFDWPNVLGQYRDAYAEAIASG
jgi:phosphatidyl-myo-inositol alpha-mannosyltransferase